jgi:predicted metalloprotease with PDZ domain
MTRFWYLLPMLIASTTTHTPPRPDVSYVVHVDTAHADYVDVTMRIRRAPNRIRLAMKVHPEYNAGLWRSVRFDAGGRITPFDSTLWQATLDGDAEIRYRVELPADTTAVHRSWRTTVRSNGALLNAPDVLLYLPDFPNVPATVDVEAPSDWRIATSLRPLTARRFRATNAAELLDAPILLGALREWRFRDAGTAFTIAYWPLPGAVPFDTTRFVAGLRALTHAALGVFGRAPVPAFVFLVQDGADDALEHRASVTLGVPSADLARDPRAHIREIAHEFFHTWNLVAIRPDHFGDLTYGATPPTTGLWWGEGVTLHYADVLVRRAGLVSDTADTRETHLEALLSRYYAAPWSRTVSPEQASLAFGHSALTDPNATGGFYLQGELLGEALDALVRDSTADRRTLDDVMRALLDVRRADRGFTPAELRATVDRVCSCRAEAFFASAVHAPGVIDLAPAARRLGWRIVADTVQAIDARGAPLADVRLSAAPLNDSTLGLIVTAPAGAWARAGLRTGDALVALNGSRPRDFAALLRTMRALHVGDTMQVDVRRAGALVHLAVVLSGYERPRVRLVDVPDVMREQRARRARWMGGW